MEQNQIAKQNIETKNHRLRVMGLMLKKGTTLVMTVINAPSSTKNRKDQMVPEIHSTAQGN